jgi:NAD-dependent dihydropyrimidine dehydrogenase PreA subunit
VIGIRDRALLLVGFAGTYRRSELVALNVEDVQVTGDGLVITLRRSRTDQEGEGRKGGLPYGSNPGTCPVCGLCARGKRLPR